MVRKKRRASASKPDPYPIGHNGMAPYLARFLEASAALGLSARTVETYERMLKRFIAWCDERGLDRLQEITRPILERYRRYLYHYRKANGEPISFATQQQRLSPMLLHRHGALTGYSGMGLGPLLRKLFRAAGIQNCTGHSPRVHDLQSTFAVHALLRWYRTGVDVQARLPALSTYMGHASIRSTQYYLTFLDVIAQTAGERFEAYCSRFLPTTSSTGGYQ